MTASVPSLSRQDERRLLSSKFAVARLATVSRAGRPHVVPVWFLYLNKKIYIPTPTRTMKAKHVSVTPYASITIDSYKGVLDAKGILIEGRAELIMGLESAKINLRIHQKYVGSNRLRRRQWKAFAAEDDGTIVVRPDKWRSWDFTRLKLSKMKSIGSN